MPVKKRTAHLTIIIADADAASVGRNKKKAGSVKTRD